MNERYKNYKSFNKRALLSNGLLATKYKLYNYCYCFCYYCVLLQF